ncbi:hypothetical protein FQR65_LT01453 [Abscondita terminalis]|nr:hypothetical protein FQR65_LT01453 [Abscondita terminalis]
MRLVYNEEMDTPSPQSLEDAVPLLRCLAQCPPAPTRFSLTTLLPSRLVPSPPIPHASLCQSMFFFCCFVILWWHQPLSVYAFCLYFKCDTQL